jgi:hypothetical protein
VRREGVAVGRGESSMRKYLFFLLWLWWKVAVVSGVGLVERASEC